MNLILAAGQFRDMPLQVKALKQLQDATPLAIRQQFANRWRQAETRAPIDFVNVFRFYREMPHQNTALQWLTQNSDPKTLAEFADRWQAANTRGIYLHVPFYSQLDNRYEPQRTCNTSATAMAARFLGAKISGDDDYYVRFVKGRFDTTDHDGHTRALAQMGIKSQWHQDLDFDDIDRQLERNKPIPIGILHRGPESAPRGGHVIVVIGRSEGDGLICHDPFGTIANGYTGAAEEGKGVFYSRATLRARWTADGAGSGWGRLFA